MVRYTILRLLIFLACLIAFWLLGLRGQVNVPFLVLSAALVSMVISYFLLRPVREEFSDQVAHKIEERTRAKAERRRQTPSAGSDEAAEDAEVDGGGEDGFR